MSDQTRAMGAVLIFIALIIYFIAVPSLATAVDTGSGGNLENESSSIKEIYSVYDTLIAVFPFILIVIGFGFMVK